MCLVLPDFSCIIWGSWNVCLMLLDFSCIIWGSWNVCSMLLDFSCIIWGSWNVCLMLPYFSCIIWGSWNDKNVNKVLNIYNPIFMCVLKNTFFFYFLFILSNLGPSNRISGPLVLVHFSANFLNILFENNSVFQRYPPPVFFNTTKNKGKILHSSFRYNFLCVVVLHCVACCLVSLRCVLLCCFRCVLCA